MLSMFMLVWLFFTGAANIFAGIAAVMDNYKGYGIWMTIMGVVHVMLFGIILGIGKLN